ncbi:MAG: NifU family protein [Planctomycetota bacterium]
MARITSKPLPQVGDSPPLDGGDAPVPEGSLFDRVHSVIERIRPAVQADGGDVELVEVTDDGVACIRLHGACVGCPSSNMTLHMGIERNLRQRVPEITAVEQLD